ncbi:NUDIX domain-containing protein [Candidatus Uhrbacteria bacterium]|nr:NUDIX domain-containing protein [Candidatus Uhrbacteria bacterium]
MLEFGIKRENEERRDGGCGVVFDPATQRYAVGRRADGRQLFFGGGVSDAEDIEAGVCREVTEESGLHDFLYVEKIAEALAHYYNSAKHVNRVAHATCFLIILKSADVHPVAHESHEKFSLVWTTAAEMMKNLEERNQDKGHDHWIYFLKKSVARARELGYDTTSGA